MCLAVPGKIVSLRPTAAPFLLAVVEFEGVRREINVSCVPEVRPGQYVMVHAGLAIAVVDAEEAAQVLDALRSLKIEDDNFADSDPVRRAPPAKRGSR